MLIQTNANYPQLVRSSRERYYALVQVTGAGAVRIAQSAHELINPFLGVNQGLTIAAADGLKGFWWRGDFWIIGDGSDALVQLSFA